MEYPRYLDYVHLYILYGAYLVRFTTPSLVMMGTYALVGALYIKRLRTHTTIDPPQGIKWLIMFAVKSVLAILFMWYIVPIFFEATPFWLELAVDLFF